MEKDGGKKVLFIRFIPEASKTATETELGI